MTQQDINYEALEKPIPPELLQARTGRWVPKILIKEIDRHGFWLIGYFSAVTIIVIMMNAYTIVIGTCLAIESIVVVGVLLLAILRRSIRMELFCRQNGFNYEASISDPDETGMIFGHGDNQRLTDVISGKINGQDFIIANYEYETGSGKNRQTHSYGYIKLKLPRTLPHMVLDAKQNDFFGTLSNLPAMFDSNQKLSLEGDFDSYFSLYCPKEYERDALYIFTPDLMALLIDKSSAFDIEIIDDMVYLYSTDTLKVTSRSVLERLFSIVVVVGKAADLRADGYSDERVSNDMRDTVAPGGTRLRPLGINFSVLIVLLIVAAIAAWLVVSGGIAFLRALP